MKIKQKINFIDRVKNHHLDQKDSQGIDYWLHPYRVSLESVRLLGEISEAIELIPEEQAKDRLFLTGLYHDVIEDCPGSFEKVFKELSEMENQGEIIRSLFLLTKPKEWIPEVSNYLSSQEMFLFREARTYLEKIEVLIGIRDPFAIIVKYCDNCDNSLPWRSKTPGKVNTKYVRSKILLEQSILEMFGVHS